MDKCGGEKRDEFLDPGRTFLLTALGYLMPTYGLSVVDT